MTKSELLDRMQELIPRFQAASQSVDLAAAQLLGLTLTEMHVMEQVLHRGPSAASTLADAVGLSPGAMTTSLDRLESAGFVRRLHVELDPHSATVHLTDTAFEEMHEMWGALSVEGDKLLRQFNLAELEVLARFLDGASALQEHHSERIRVSAARRRR